MGSDPESRGPTVTGGMTMVSEEEKKFLALVTEPHLEQLI